MNILDLYLGAKGPLCISCSPIRLYQKLSCVRIELKTIHVHKS